MKRSLSLSRRDNPQGKPDDRGFMGVGTPRASSMRSCDKASAKLTVIAPIPQLGMWEWKASRREKR